MRVRVRAGRVYVNLDRVAGVSFAVAVFADGLALDGTKNLDGFWRPLRNPIFRDAPSYRVPRELAEAAS